jgi:hypothetical protein
MQKRHVQQNISANNTPNATAGTMNLSAVFTRVEVLKTFTPPFHRPIIKLPQYNAIKGGTASSKIRPLYGM